MPDMECTAWLDGIPKWLGGTGDEFLPCCIWHDVSPFPKPQADAELAQCMADMGYPLMGFIMFVGLSTAGWLWHIHNKRKLK